MTMTSLPRTVIGTILKRKLGKGSKSDRIVNAILTEDGIDLVIRHDGGTAFEDTIFDALEGKRVRLTGVMQSFVMIVSDLAELGLKEKISEPLTEGASMATLSGPSEKIASGE